MPRPHDRLTTSLHRCVGGEFRVATYNVHRWAGVSGRSLLPALAGAVIAELDADVIALQEVLRPFDAADPLTQLADILGMHVVFGATRFHRHGTLGNALLSRWPAQDAEWLDLSLTRHERRGAVVVRYRPGPCQDIQVVATHLALGARTRTRQVRLLLAHLRRQGDPVVLLGDLNLWRPGQATRTLAHALGDHHVQEWPRTFPAPAPLFALDRIYTRGVHLTGLQVHNTPAARKGSDHLPVLASLTLY